MRAADLDIHELLNFVPDGGRITFAGERVLLLDAVALGLLRKELIETLGVTQREPYSPDSVTHTAGASPKRSARDFPGTARTTGAPRERAYTRYRVSCARR